MSTAELTFDLRLARRHLERQVDEALGRLRFQEFLNALVLVATIACWVLVPAVIADRLLSLTAAGYNLLIFWGFLWALAIPYIVWRSFHRRNNERLAAVLADERLGLHARLCTAISLNPREAGGFGEAFYAEAAEKLARLHAAMAFPLRIPRLAYLLPLPLLLAAGLWWLVPQRDQLGLLAKREERKRADAAMKEKLKKIVELEDMRKKEEEGKVHDRGVQYRVNSVIKQAKDIARQVEQGEKTREEAIVALSELKRQLREDKERPGEDKDLSERLQKLKSEKLNLDEDDLTKDVSAALKSGDVEQAARELRKLAQKMRKDVLEDKNKTEEQKQQELAQLKEEVERLAEALKDEQGIRQAMQEVAQKSDEYKKLMEEIQKQEQKQDQKGGKSAEQMAKDLEKSLEEAADELQKADTEGLEEDAEAAEKAEEVEEALDEAMEGLAGGCEGGEKGQAGKQAGKQGKGKGKGGRQARAARAGQQGEKRGQPKVGQQGNEQKGGQPGQGQTGGGPGEGHRAYNENDVQFKDEKVRGKLQPGAITSLKYFRGQGAKSEAPADYRQALAAAEADAASSLDLDRTPADQRELVKQYFLGLRRDQGPPGAPAPGPGTAPKAKGAGESLKE